MKRRELRKQLKILGVNKDFYSLNGIEIPGRTILRHSEGQWRVYNIDERGRKTDEMVFTLEDEACTYVLKILKEEKDLQDRINKESLGDIE